MKVYGTVLQIPKNYNKTGITIKNSNFVDLDVNFLYACGAEHGGAGSVGLYLLGNDTGCMVNTIDIRVIRNVDTGVLLESLGDNGFSSSNRITILEIYCVNTGVKLLNDGLALASNTFLTTTVYAARDYGFWNEGSNYYYDCRTIDFDKSPADAVDFYNAVDAEAVFASGIFCGAGDKTHKLINNGKIKFWHVKFFITDNSGNTTIANAEYVAHGLDPCLNIGQSNSTVLVTAYTTIYDGVPVVVGCNIVSGTHIRISAYWTNNTAITDDAIQIWWRVTYP